MENSPKTWGTGKAGLMSGRAYCPECSPEGGLRWWGRMDNVLIASKSDLFFMTEVHEIKLLEAQESSFVNWDTNVKISLLSKQCEHFNYDQTWKMKIKHWCFGISQLTWYFNCAVSGRSLSPAQASQSHILTTLYLRVVCWMNGSNPTEASHPNIVVCRAPNLTFLPRRNQKTRHPWPLRLNGLEPRLSFFNFILFLFSSLLSLALSRAHAQKML